MLLRQLDRGAGGHLKGLNLKIISANTGGKTAYLNLLELNAIKSKKKHYDILWNHYETIYNYIYMVAVAPAAWQRPVRRTIFLIICSMMMLILHDLAHHLRSL